MKIITGNKVDQIIDESINLIYDSVAHTLGPKGSNAIVNVDGKTIITNDGITIVNNISFDDEKNIVLDIIKEGSKTTETKSGDGTTSTIVLTKAIYDISKEYLQDYNKVLLKNEILKAYNIFEKLINEQKKVINSLADIKGIATISAGGNKFIGEKVAEAFSLVNFKGNINFRIDDISETINVVKNNGYILESDYIGYDDFKNKEFMDIDILIYEGDINTLSDIKELAINRRNDNRPIIVLSNFSKDALMGIFQYNNAGLRIIPCSLPSFGKKRETMLNELKLLTNAATLDKNIPFIKYNEDDITSGVGNIESIEIKDNFIILKKKDEEFEKFLKIIKDNNIERYEDIKNGVSEILIGAKTKVEAEELLLRIEDSVNSVRNALKHGISIGGANLLYKITFDNYILNSKNIGVNILAKALKYPLEQIIKNNGDDLSILEELKSKIFILNKSNITEMTLGFNAETSKIENLYETKILDPVITIINTLKSAVSIAVSLLSVNCIIDNKKNKNGGLF